MEAWMDDMYTACMDSMIETFREFKVPLPFTKDEFIKKCETKGFFCLFTILMFFL